MKCQQCDSVGINGVLCHETGCPNHHIDLTTGKPFKVKCRWCGTLFDPECQNQVFCDETCAIAYNY